MKGARRYRPLAENRKQQNYTLVVFRTGRGVHRKLTLPVRQVKGLVWLLAPVVCALFLGAVTAIALYLVNLRNINDYDRLARQNRELKKQVEFFSRRLGELSARLTALQESNARVKVMANLAVVPGARERHGVGGPDPLAVELTVSCLDAEHQRSLARLHEELQAFELGLSHEEEELQALSDCLRQRQLQLNFTPSIWPVRGWISSRYGYRVSPFTGRRELHRGLDIVNRIGTPIVATADGRVVFAGYKRGYGKMVVIDHGFGRVTKYGHLSRIEVQRDDEVVRGQRIGRLGSTGRSTGPHLHYEVVVNGKTVNPMDYLLD